MTVTNEQVALAMGYKLARFMNCADGTDCLEHSRWSPPNDHPIVPLPDFLGKPKRLAEVKAEMIRRGLWFAVEWQYARWEATVELRTQLVVAHTWETGDTEAEAVCAAFVAAHAEQEEGK